MATGRRTPTVGPRGSIAQTRGTLVRQRGVMPFKSQAQRRKFAQLLVEGKISNQTFEEWNRETGRKKLPERVAPKPSARKNASGARKKRTRAKRRR
jgi:hypothetical protein